MIGIRTSHDADVNTRQVNGHLEMVKPVYRDIADRSTPQARRVQTRRKGQTRDPFKCGFF